MWEKRRIHKCCLYTLIAFPLYRGMWFDDRAKQQHRDEGTTLILMRSFLLGWCCGHLRTLRLLAIPELFLEGGSVLSLSVTGCLPQLSPSSSVTIFLHSPTPKPSLLRQRRTKLGTEPPSLHMLDYQQVGPFPSWGHKVCCCLLEQFTWRKLPH